jgi:hypothetical protein
MRAQQFGAGRLDHPAQPSLLTYLYSPTRQHDGIARCPDCVLDMLASDRVVHWHCGLAGLMVRMHCRVSTYVEVMQSVQVVEPTSTQQH